MLTKYSDIPVIGVTIGAEASDIAENIPAAYNHFGGSDACLGVSYHDRGSNSRVLARVVKNTARSVEDSADESRTSIVALIGTIDPAKNASAVNRTTREVGICKSL